MSQKADSMLNHILKNIMADAHGCVIRDYSDVFPSIDTNKSVTAFVVSSRSSVFTGSARLLSLFMCLQGSNKKKSEPQREWAF